MRMPIYRERKIMKKQSKYQIEIDSFKEAFSIYMHKKIALYGIGRRTLTLLPEIVDYNIVALLDRENENIGKFICNIPVVSIEKIDEVADMVIINSDPPTNYSVIYKRINKIGIPIFWQMERNHVNKKAY